MYINMYLWKGNEKMEYGITNVDYKGNEKGDEHIAKVRVYEIANGKKVNKLFEDEEVEIVIKKIKNKCSYVTFPSEKIGAKVIVKKGSKREYITTIPDGENKNNLGSLPPIPGLWD